VWFSESAPISLMLLLQAALGAGDDSLVYLLGRDQFGRSVAILAAVGMTLAPLTSHFTAVILSETFFTFLLTLGCVLLGPKEFCGDGCGFWGWQRSRA